MSPSRNLSNREWWDSPPPSVRWAPHKLVHNSDFFHNAKHSSSRFSDTFFYLRLAKRVHLSSQAMRGPFRKQQCNITEKNSLFSRLDALPVQSPEYPSEWLLQGHYTCTWLHYLLAAYQIYFQVWSYIPTGLQQPKIPTGLG